MTDQIMTPTEQQKQHSDIIIMRELSDIKSVLASGTVETQHIKVDVSEVKSDVKEIKADFVNRRELDMAIITLRKEFADANSLLLQKFTDAVDALKEDIALPKKIIYGAVALILVAVFGALIGLVIVNTKK